MIEIAPFTRDTVKVIQKNAGRVPKEKMAHDLGWSVTFLERVANERNIDLRLYKDRDSEFVTRNLSLRPTSADRTETPRRPTMGVILDERLWRAVEREAGRRQIRSRSALLRQVIDAIERRKLWDFLLGSLRGEDSPSSAQSDSPSITGPHESGVNPRFARNPQGGT